MLASFRRPETETELREAESELPGRSSLTEHLIASVTPPASGACLVVVTPATTLDSPGSASFRRVMGKRWHPAAIVEVGDAGLPMLHSSFRLAVTAWTSLPAANVHVTRFFTVPSARVAAQEIFDDLDLLLRRAGGRTRFGYVLREAISLGAPLGFRANSPEARAHEEELHRYPVTRELTDVFQIIRGRVPRDLPMSVGTSAPAGMVRLLGGRDVLQDGSIADADDHTRWVEQTDLAPPLVSGDLVFREILAPKHQRFIFARYTHLDDPATPASGVVVLRPHGDVSTEAVRVSLAYLGSKHCKTLHDMAASTLGGHIRLGLQSMRLPQPDSALAAAVREIEDAKEKFEAWSFTAREVISSAFEEGTPTEAHAHIVATGRNLRLRAEAASSIDDFSTGIRTRFPHPLSYRWRTVEANLSAGTVHQAFSEILEAAEVVLCLLANLALAAARDVGRSIGAMTSVTDKLSSRRSGPSFGDWLTILSEVHTSRTLRSAAPERHVLHDLGDLLADGPAEQAIRSMKSRRDDYAHLRRPTALEQETQEALGDLRTMYSAAFFMAETPLHAVDSTTWDSIEGVGTAQTRDLVGDHSVVATRELKTEFQLDSGSLYLGTQTGLLLLRPYLIGRACRDCGHWSTFHADRFDGAEMTLKSLERGHTMSDANQVRAFRAAGLIV